MQSNVLLESIQVGLPQQIADDWHTSIFKTRVDSPVFLSRTNLDGDKQADLTVHGGPDKAVNVYPIEHYQYWNQRARFLVLKRINLPSQPNGAFGENFTISNITENEICIGDSFTIGDAIVQVSQPRQPCWKLARKFKQTKLPFWVQETSKTGWYFRVLQEGTVEAGQGFNLIEQPNPKWTIKRANSLMYTKNRSQHELEEILQCKELSQSWQETFKKLIR